MKIEQAVRRAQIYSFLAGAYLYPSENWTADAPLLGEMVADLGWASMPLTVPLLDLEQLQAAYLHTFGLTGSLCYETEYGLPHEFRQSQEMADLCGFYRAFGLNLGGAVRERPDHLATELEFLYVLALKEAYAAQHDVLEHVEVCEAAQRKFLDDHLGRWIEPFARSVAYNGGEPYQALASFTAAFVRKHAAVLGVQPQPLHGVQLKPTPFDPDFSCAGCAVAELAR
jgi:DMSO reductase family type II enzyme chaperone